MKIKMLFSAVIASVIMFTSLSCSKSDNGGTPPPPPPPSTVSLNISNMTFPASTTVKKGTIVKWTNKDAMAHTVSSDDGTSFESGNMASGATFSYTTTKSGTYPYHCAYHSGMTASLIVTD